MPRAFAIEIATSSAARAAGDVSIATASGPVRIAAVVRDERLDLNDALAVQDAGVGRNSARRRSLVGASAEPRGVFVQNLEHRTGVEPRADGGGSARQRRIHDAAEGDASAVVRQLQRERDPALGRRRAVHRDGDVVKDGLHAAILGARCEGPAKNRAAQLLSRFTNAAARRTPLGGYSSPSVPVPGLFGPWQKSRDCVTMTAQRTVLLVDDEPGLLDVLEQYLRDESFSVVRAGDGPTAIEQFEKHMPDVVVLDINLPGYSGTEVLRRIRAVR